MGQKRKKSAEAMLEKARGQQVNKNSATSHDLPQQVSNDQRVARIANVNITPTLNDDNVNSSSSANEAASSHKKKEPLLVKIRDSSSGEITNQMMQPDRVWNLEKHKKIIVQIDRVGQGSDNGSNLLVRFLGKLAKKSAFCPISVERWDRMPEDKTCLQWQTIEDHFEFDYIAGIKWVMHSLCDRWKTYKQKLRDHRFHPYKTKEQILANCPSDVDSTDWTAFVHHYTSHKMKETSSQNAKNRKNLKVSHAGGSKSNARRGREMELELGRPVCRGEVVLSTLTNKNGNYVNEEGKILADKIKEHLPQDQEHAATLCVPLKILAHPNDSIGKIRGPEHSGRCKIP